MSRYAEGTKVSADRSREEIAATVRRYGAEGFATGWHGERAMVTFVAHGRQVRLTLQLPSPIDAAFHRTATGLRRGSADALRAYQAEIRRLWRALLLVIKAKFEIVESGIVSFEEEWEPFIVLPGDRTVGEYVQPAVAEAYATGTVPPILPAFGRPAIEQGP